MTNTSPPQRARGSISALAVLLPLLLMVVVAAFALWSLRDGETEPAPDPLQVAASGPTFESLDELIAAADLIVEGKIVGVEPGRTITDPTNPDAGFTTSLFQLDVSQSYRGPTVDQLIVEQESTLLDGTPIIVNGLEANRVGDTGFWLLVKGGDEAFPYVALVNEQARLLVTGSELRDPAFDDVADADDVRARLSQAADEPANTD